MNNQEKINFRQVRDFGEVFNVSVKFFRQNFKLFFQSLIFIAGPFILISAIAGAFYQSNAANLFSFTRTGSSDIFSQFGWTYFVFIIAAVIANIMLLGTVFGFMINYMEKGPDGFSVNDVVRTVVKNIGNILSVFFILLFLTIIVLTLSGVIVYFIASAVPVLGVILGIALFFGVLILFPPLMWQLSIVYLVKMQEKGNVFKALNHTGKVMRGNFWWTWVIMVCAVLAVGIISFVFALPQAVYSMVLMFSHIKDASGETSIPFIIVATICTFCSTILYSALYVISAFHYYSLSEQKDGIGLMERIDEIGNTTNNNVEQNY